MQKFTKINYKEVKAKKVSATETAFEVFPLERGFANTYGNAIRRTLLSSITGVAPFAVKINGASHEFQILPGVIEDVVNIILNLKQVSFIYNPEVFADNEIIKVTLKSDKGKVHASDFILPAGVEISNPDQFIATSSKAGDLDLELFLISGRGFVSFEENKSVIKKNLSKLETSITNGQFIAMDSDFSPIVNVSYESVEMNSASAVIEEKLIINVKTNGTVDAKDAIAQAAHILIAHLEVLADVSNLEREEIFSEARETSDEGAIAFLKIDSLELSVRSYNCLKRAGFETLEDLTKLSYKELSQIKNLGKKSVDEIVEKLSEHDIHLEAGK